MKRAGFLRALVGAGVGAVVVPKVKEEEDFTVTSEDGRTAWDSERSQVWQEYREHKEGDAIAYKYYTDGSVTYWSGNHWIPYLP